MTRSAWREWWNDPEALSYYFMGKDNITFHSQIWPAELLAYNGKGSRGRDAARVRRAQPAHRGGQLSEFLTMEGKKFSSSKRVVIYVRDLLSRYQPDAFRYFVAAAGPENQDSDFTWAEFVRRTNDELVAGWGNLVNRTATLINKNFGEIPPLGETTPEDEAVLAASEAAFGTVGDLIGRNRMQAGASTRRCGRWPRSTSTSPTRSRGRSRTTARAARHDPARHRAVRGRPQPGAVAVPAVLGQRGRPGARREGRDRADAAHRRGRGPRRRRAVPDHHRRLLRPRPRGRASRSRSALPVAKPTPIFTKLDPAIVDEELARLEA